jgi:hypothetical protein
MTGARLVATLATTLGIDRQRIVATLIGSSRWLALRDAGSGLGETGCRGPRVQTNPPPMAPVIRIDH